MKLLQSGTQEGQHLMDKDRNLLRELKQTPLLHLYNWAKPTLSYGLLLDPTLHLNLAACNSLGVDVVKRPTGGGILFHGTDLAFSFLLPKTHPLYSTNLLQSYHSINSIVQDALSKWLGKKCTLTPTSSLPPQERFSFCMAEPTIFDVFFEGKKLAGAAQRRTHTGLLHQGTISCLPPEKNLFENVLLHPEAILPSMEQNSFFLTTAKEKLDTLREELTQGLIDAFSTVV